MNKRLFQRSLSLSGCSLEHPLFVCGMLNFPEYEKSNTFC